jgi:hypothetical protein
MATNIPRTADAPSSQWSAEVSQVDDGQTAIQVASADPQRRSVTVFNDPDSAGVLWLTPNSGSKSGGIRLVPGAGYQFNTGAAIYGRATGGDCTANTVTESGASC